jgi:hypothetical protein
MPTTTQDNDTTVVTLPTGADVYNGIMSEIEPDLVNDMIPLLDMKYAGETPIQNAARLARYRAAYDEYAVRFAAWAEEMSTLVQKYRKSALKLEEKQSLEKESSVLTSLEDQFATSSTPSL